MPKTVFFSVGEPSGDQHAARLIRQFAEREGDVRFRGFGGPAMTAAGCRLDRDLTQHAVVGIVEVLPKLRQFFRFVDQAEDVFRRGEVDAVVLVDFPGFNWHIAKRAKRYGIPVYYYCPPQLWAWGGWRIHKMRKTVDHVMAVLPIEKSYFSDAKIPTTFLGHPFFDAVAEKRLHEPTLCRLESIRNAGGEVVAVLPGSRTHEVQQNWPLMLEAIAELHQRHPGVRFQVAAYRDRHCLWCRDHLTDQHRNLPIDFYVDRTSEIIQAAKCAMMVSGSVSLELMARRTPAAVVYRVGRLLHAFASRVVRLDSITLPNLMNGRQIFPEMVSVGPTAPAVRFLTESVDAMLSDRYYFQGLRSELDRLANQYARPGGTSAAVDFLADRLGVDLCSPSRTDEPGGSAGVGQPANSRNGDGMPSRLGQTQSRRAA